MAWGMPLPPGSNGFYLEGEFEGPRPVASCGWRERLKEHYKCDLPDEQRVLFDDGLRNGPHWYACHAVGKFSLDHRLHLENNPAETIANHEVPRYFQVSAAPSTIASLVRLSENVLAVSETLKSFIEWLEPGVHRFFPIDIRRPRGRTYPEPYHILVIGHWLDSFSAERSAKDAFKPNLPGFFSHSERPKDIRALALRREVFGTAHLWRERRLVGWMTCFSDRLQAEIADAGPRIPRHYRMIEV